MVSLLILGLILKYNLISPVTKTPTNTAIGIVVAVVCLLGLIWAVWQSKRESGDFETME